jgi:hypothetical protein
MKLRGCYLVSAKWPFEEDIEDGLTDGNEQEEIFVYATKNEIFEFICASDEEIANNAKRPYGQYKVDSSRTCFQGDARLADYSNIRFLFNSEELKNLFNEKNSVDAMYMQCSIAQFCRWHQEVPKVGMFAECLKAIEEFRANGSKYPGYEPNFETSTPEDIERIKKELGIVSKT